MSLYNYYLLCLLIALFSMQTSPDAQVNSISIFPQTVQYPKKIPSKKDVWVFIMAGQSNMAGRAAIESEDTLCNERILTINEKDEIIVAKEPLHFYEPSMRGLDAGISFSNKLLESIPPTVSILLMPAAVGGSSIKQWLGDSLHRGIMLLSNLKSKMLLGEKYGTIKAILWHQGESDATRLGVNGYQYNLFLLHNIFRTFAHNSKLPIITGGIGLFEEDNSRKKLINEAIYANAEANKYTYIIGTSDFEHKGDKLHFNSYSQRLMGERMALMFIETLQKKIK